MIIFILLCCNQGTRVRTPRQHTTNHRETHRNHHHHRHNLHGIDAPPGIDPLEHEEVPMRVQNTHHNVKPILAPAQHASPERHVAAARHGSPERPVAGARHGSLVSHAAPTSQTSTGRPLGNFSQVTALMPSFYIKPNDTVSLYRARMDNRDVILRALK
ncbi:hypothetical protein GOODEAATRI_007100, partial [Goodea atripinnis]